MIQIAFITDGSQKMGMGHITRTLTLANELKDRAGIFFLIKSDKTVTGLMESASFTAYQLKNDEEIIRVLSEKKPDTVIIDKLDVPEVLAGEIKEIPGIKLVLFDNTTDANKYADIVVNAVMGSNYKNRKFFDNKTNTLYFYGLKYEVLREEFYGLQKPGNKNLTIKRIMLIFGGSDPSNLTSAALDELLRQPKDFKVDVILGAHFEYNKELNEVMTRYPDKQEQIGIFQNIKNVAELMYQADLVIASPGLSVFESLCVGTPVISIHQNAWQKNGFKGFLPTLDKSEIYKLGEMIVKSDYADPHSEYIKSFQIGQGKKEVIEAIIGS